MSTPYILGDAGLIALMVLIGGLLVGTLILSAYAIAMRSLNLARDRESAELTQRWREPVLSAVADPGLIPSVQQLVAEDDAIHFLNFVIEYARRVRGEEGVVLRDLAQPFLPRMADRVRSRRTEMRAWAVQTLGTLGLPEYGEEVVAALDDPSPLVAMVAARALSREETPQYASEVLARLDRFTGWNRVFLAAMLAAIGPEVSHALRAELANEESSPWTRAIMAEALCLQGDFLAADIAASIVASSPDRDLLAAALRLLALVGRPEHAAAIRAHCRSPDSVVRAQALRALGPLGDAGDVSLLIEAMGDAGTWPALYAARAARDAGGKDVLAGMVASGHASAALAEQVLAEEGDR